MDATAGSSRRTALALAGLLLVLAAPVAYLATMQATLLLRTGLLLWGLLAAGLAAGFAAVRADRRRWIRVAAGADVAVAAFFLAAFFVFAALPGAEAAQRLETAPGFSLSDQEGKTVSLADARASGPVLFVFFRGAW